MARDIEVRVLGDAASLERAVGKSAALLAKFSGDATKAADAQVAAGVREREDLAKLAAAFQATADSAAKGSDEQIVAAKKAADAQRSLAATTKTTATEQSASFGKATAGAMGFVKQMAFFGAGFLGFEGLKASIQTVLASATSISQLDRAIVNAHASVEALTPILDRYADSARRLGFTDDQTRQAEAELVTAFGATKKALGELRDAEDLARAKNEDLGTAAQQLILLQEGNTRAAKQFGLALPDLTKKQWEAKAAQDGLTLSQEKGKLLYDELLPRIKDQAQAFANSPSGKIAEFHAEIQKLEESIGQGLLPSVDQYLTRVDDWLAKGQNQKRVTHDVEEATHLLAGVLHDAATMTHDFLDYANPIAHALGGWKTVIEILIGLKFASVVAGWTSNIGKLIGAEGAGGLLGGEAAAGGLLVKLRALAGLGVISVELLLAMHFISKYGLHNAVAAGLNPTQTLGPGLTNPGLITVDGKTYQTGTGAAWDALIKAGWKPPKGTNSDTVTGPQEVRAARALGGGGDTASGPASRNNIVTTAQWAAAQPGAATSYKWGGVAGIGKGSHTDCSGFTQAVYKQNGVSIPRTSQQQYASAPQHPKRNELQPGDLVFFDYEGPHSHVGIYIGGGMMIADQHTGSGIVTVPVDWNHFDGAASYSKMPRGGSGGGGGAGTGTNPYGPPLTTPTGGGGGGAGSATKHKVPVISGANLLPESLRNAITHAQTKALDANSPQVAEKWLKSELADLEQARKLLEQKLKTATGKEKAAIQQELRNVDTQIALTQKSIVSAAAKWAKSQLAVIEKQADAAFDKQTQAGIDKLGAQFFQGTDAQGNQRQTPAEAALAAMQAADQQQSLDDALTQAQQQLASDQAARAGTPATTTPGATTVASQGDKYNAEVDITGEGTTSGGTAGVTAQQIAADKAAVVAARRAIVEQNLATQATQQRAKADADYAKAVTAYEAKRAKEEKAMNATLAKTVESMAKTHDGFAALIPILQEFGVSVKSVTAIHRHKVEHVIHVRPEEYKKLATNIAPFLDGNVTLKLNR